MADIAVLSLLWTICSLPIVTIGASSAALMRCAMNMHTNEGNWRARHYFQYFRRYFRKATLIWLPLLLIAGLFILDLWILKGAGTMTARVQRYAAVCGLILWVITAVWAFMLVGVIEAPVFQTIKNALAMGISYLPRTVAMGVLWLLPVALAVFAPVIFQRIIVLWPALFYGGTAYYCAKLMVKPLTPYLDILEPEDDEELSELDFDDDDKFNGTPSE